MNVVTRFAPSPTGFLHIGGARTALFNYLFTRRYKGKFLLRIEDTDKVRSTDKAIKAIISGLEWLNLNHDGKIVFQSNNSLRHKNIADELLKSGNAYRCYLSNEEQNQIRNDCMKRGLPFRSPWRNKKYNNENENSYVIRIKMPDEGFTEIKDLVQGKVRFANNKLDDFVLLRSNSLPTYMLAVVVDDYDMGITHIIRGDDHLNNAFRQYWIYKFLDWKVPDFAHIPLIHGEDGSKLSKRHGSLGIEHYIEEGYLPEAIINYLLRLGWSHGDQEIFSLEEMINYFSIEKIRKSPSKFDIEKLNDINSIYLKNSSFESLIARIDTSYSNLTKDKIKSISIVMPEVLKRYKNIKDIKKNISFITNKRPIKIDKDVTNLINGESISCLEKLSKILKKLDKWDANEIEQTIKKFLKDEELNFKDIGLPLRVVLVGFLSPIGINTIIESLGKDEVLGRIEDIIK